MYIYILYICILVQYEDIRVARMGQKNLLCTNAERTETSERLQGIRGGSSGDCCGASERSSSAGDASAVARPEANCPPASTAPGGRITGDDGGDCAETVARAVEPCATTAGAALDALDTGAGSALVSTP